MTGTELLCAAIAVLAVIQLCVWLALDDADATHHQENPHA